jgi:DNA helicase-2/ATP-dependent DNA helicase PcrA
MTAILQAIVARHTDMEQVDREQLEAVFSSAPHLLVEAPAGYGKTRTMVSKIAFLIAKGGVGYPKRILALTFSINAAFKIRSDVSQQLPSLLSTSPRLSRYALHAVYATNYHGLSRRILNRYGYLISPELRRVDALKGVSIDIYEKDTYTKKRLDQDLQDWGVELTEHEIECLIQYTRVIKQAGVQDERPSACRYLARNTSDYLEIVEAKFLPKDCIPFDAILLFVRQLLNSHPSVRRFYRQFFQVVIVDEFQDTNILQWTLLQDIVGRDNERQNPLYVFGDRHQKIYEFIGAMQGIINEAKTYYGMQEIGLGTNHRFKNNSEMLRFDHNVREIAQNPREPEIESIAEIEVVRSANQDEEAERILTLVQMLLDQDPNCTLAILTRAGKSNQNTIMALC